MMLLGGGRRGFGGADSQERVSDGIWNRFFSASFELSEKVDGSKKGHFNCRRS